jgi:hypothetical protein
MSDTIPVQHESAVAVLRDMAREVEVEIAGLAENMRLASARQDTLQDAIAKLTRKPRVRAPRPVTDAREPAGVFALPANDAAGETEAA